VATKIALPKGSLLRRTSALLQKAEWGLDEYHSRMGFYHPRSQRFPELKIKVIHEKDIPVQVAIGNYDLGICSLAWIEELLTKYPGSALVKIRDLLYGYGSLYIAAVSAPELTNNGTPVRIASEYPNLAENYALRVRLSRFSIFPVWGAAEAYPPENADMSLIFTKTEADIHRFNLTPVGMVLDSSAFLIANRNSWESKNMNDVISSICEELPDDVKRPVSSEDISKIEVNEHYRKIIISDGTVRLALPDGHQQERMLDILNRSGIGIEDYPSSEGNRRPVIKIEGISAKVIRPQDMPLQVANGSFDLAITGRDWLREHLYQFPASPVKELLDIKSGRVRIVAVVSKDLPIDNIEDLRRFIAGIREPFRVASEYVNIADMYARENHLGRYRVIPTWGATEAFLPDDADMLIENTETGGTIARHNLKIIDTLFESTACLVGNKDALSDSGKNERIQLIINKLRTAVGDD